MLKLKDILHVVSLHLKKFLILPISEFDQFIFSLLHLFLEMDIITSGLHQRNSQFSWKHDSHHIHLFNNHTVHDEFVSQIIFQAKSELSLDISHSNDSLVSDKVSNAFLAFLLKKFLKPVWSKIVIEFFTISFLLFLRGILSPNMEINPNI